MSEQKRKLVKGNKVGCSGFFSLLHFIFHPPVHEASTCLNTKSEHILEVSMDLEFKTLPPDLKFR